MNDVLNQSKVHFIANQHYENATGPFTKCDLQPENPWCGQFGILQIVEVIYLTILTVIGSVGNLLVIFSIAFEKRVTKHGNLFIINLAVADFYVTGIYVPSIIAHVFKTGNAVTMLACQAFAYGLVVTCLSSVANLALIAFNRYCAVVHSPSYAIRFSLRNIYVLVVLAWVWSNLLASPTLYGWSGLIYDNLMMNCAYDTCASLSYNIFLLGLGIFLPMTIIVFCYWKLFRNVKTRGRWVRSLHQQVSRPNEEVTVKQRRSLVREINLLKTLAITVVVFICCWLPFGLCILVNADSIKPHPKKIISWLAISNSGVNFIIYGLMNPVYRKGYKNLIMFIFCCKSCRKVFNNEPTTAVLAAVSRKPNIKLESKTLSVQAALADIKEGVWEVREDTPEVETKTQNESKIYHSNNRIQAYAQVNPC